MSVPHPGGDPNAQLYEQLKRDVLERAPQVELVEYVPNEIEARSLRATVDPHRLDPPTGPESPELTVKWYRQTPRDWFHVDYSDPNTGFHAGWHQDEDHPDLGYAHVQVAVGDETDRRGVEFDHETPSLVLWEIVESLFEEVLPTYTEPA
ncbi:hypothetical protein [Halopiger goleimassiliensis]|uniref:hypothetical protein n=1 Tax=Halopiger goleimassiliensis TaxID=1293048 RepID=UPI0006781B49|nr:hypothetical protein [Halopiger goleimassiliensis]